VFRYDVTAADAEQVISGMRACAPECRYVKRFSDDAITLRLPRRTSKDENELSRIAYINNESLRVRCFGCGQRAEDEHQVKEKLVSDLTRSSIRRA
jgi:hypothetical protein